MSTCRAPGPAWITPNLLRWLAACDINATTEQYAHAAVGLDQPARRVRLQSLRNDPVLNRDVRQVIFADGKRFVLSLRDGEMIKDLVVPVGDGGGAIAVAIDTHARADEARDGTINRIWVCTLLP